MKFFKKTAPLIIMLVVTWSFLKCKSIQKVNDNMPLEIGQVYYQNSTEEGFEINLYIPIITNPNHIALDSVYFHGRQTTLEISNDSLAIGHFKPIPAQKKDFIMSSDPYAEYGNQVPTLEKRIPFNLKENECVISYKEGEVVKYFKIGNILKK